MHIVGMNRSGTPRIEQCSAAPQEVAWVGIANSAGQECAMGVCQQVGHCVTHCACTIIQELCAQQALCSAVCVCAHRYRSTVCTHIKALCNTSCTTDTRAVHAATHGQCAHPAHGLQQLRALWCAAPTLTSPGSACKRPGVEHQGYLCSSRRLMSPDHQQ